MGINPEHFLSVVCVPACKNLNMLSKNALALMMGTAAIESGYGRSLIQVGQNGGQVVEGGYGPFQMQKITHDDCWKQVISKSSKISGAFWNHPVPVDFSIMTTNLLYAAMMCRAQYSRFKEALPNYKDVNAVYNYYKKYWNTGEGDSTLAKWVDPYLAVIKLINSEPLS